MFARLRIADHISGIVARLTTGSGGLTLGRAGFAPAGRQTKFHEVIASSFPFDPHCLVALIFLYSLWQPPPFRPGCGHAHHNTDVRGCVRQHCQRHHTLDRNLWKGPGDETVRHLPVDQPSMPRGAATAPGITRTDCRRRIRRPGRATHSKAASHSSVPV